MSQSVMEVGQPGNRAAGHRAAGASGSRGIGQPGNRAAGQRAAGQPGTGQRATGQRATGQRGSRAARAGERVWHRRRGGGPLRSMENEATALTDAVEAADVAAATDIADELLVEEISIDGMCGVY